MDIGNSFERFTDTLFEWLPRLAGALIVVLVTWIAARVVARVIRKAMKKADVDAKVKSRQTRPDLGRWIEKLSISGLVSRLGFWLVWLAGISIAVTILDIAALNAAVAAIWAYVPNVLAALAILLVATLVSAAVVAGVRRVAGETALGRIVATAAPALILTVAVFMALVQLEIATEIVAGAFYITLGAIALGAALAFGLGGREVAAHMLDSAYEKGREKAPQMRDEMRASAENAKQEADVRDRVGSSNGTPSDTPPVGAETSPYSS